VPDRFHNSLEITRHFIVPEPHDAKPSSFEKFGPSGIESEMGLHPMLAAVELDREPDRGREKIDDIDPDWMLTSKRQAELIVAQAPPQLLLGVCHGAPEPARPACLGSYPIESRHRG
jgi:hypothetical protein